MRSQFFLLVISVSLTSCGDSESNYITCINNTTGYEIIVNLSEESTIVCQPNQETIIEEYWGGSVTKLSCRSPDVFKNNNVEFIIDEGARTLTKDVYDDSNWSCKGDEDWSLIMVGNYYSKITSTFVINDEDIK